MVGIYKIENKVNGKVYIGQSNDIYMRRCCHKCELRAGRHVNCHLQAAWKKYGEDSFEFSLVEECDLNELDEKEIYWIAKFKSFNPDYGYNMTIGGGGLRGFKLSDEQKQKISDGHAPERIVQLDFDGNIVRRWRSATQAQRTLPNNIRARSILQCARHVSYQANGYIWFFEKEYDLIADQFDIKAYKFEHRSYFDIPIIQIDLWGNVVNKINKSDCNKDELVKILRVCNHERKTYNGYIWKYEYDDFKIDNEYLFYCRLSNNQYIIIQSDVNNNVIMEWNREGLSQSIYNPDTIHKFCNDYLKRGKRGLYKGYFWEYKLSA